MRQVFILDENIIQFGLSEPEGSTNPSKLLIDNILVNRHTLAWSTDVLNKWTPKAFLVRRAFPSPVTRFLQSIYDPDRFLQVLDVPELPAELESRVKDAPDLPFVRLAAAVDNGCLLVTTDQAQRTSVSEAGIDGDYNFRIVSPEQALPLSGPSDDV